MVTLVKLLDDAYRTEKNVDVRERLLLVRRVLVDNEQAARVAEKQFYRSRRRMWTPERMRPIVTVTGSHQKTCVFGTITIDGKQFFRQYDVFNQYAYLNYLKELQRKFRKLLLFIDRAAQHRSSIMIRKHL